MKKELKAPATLRQIADAYNISTKTMRSWLRIAGIYTRHNIGRKLYTAREIQQIIDEIGPYNL